MKKQSTYLHTFEWKMSKRHGIGWKMKKRQVLYAAVKKARKNGYKHILEFGVHKGASLIHIRNSLKNKWDKYKIYGFDCFTGFPKDWKNICGEIIHGGVKGACDNDGQIPDIPGVRFFKGLFEHTIPEYNKEIDAPISLLHIDCDLYDPTVEVLEGLNGSILPGTIIVYDDWTYPTKHGDSIHQQKAHVEWLEKYNRECEHFSWERLFDPKRKKDHGFSSMMARVII